MSISEHIKNVLPLIENLPNQFRVFELNLEGWAPHSELQATI